MSNPQALLNLINYLESENNVVVRIRLAIPASPDQIHELVELIRAVGKECKNDSAIDRRIPVYLFGIVAGMEACLPSYPREQQDQLQEWIALVDDTVIDCLKGEVVP